MNLQDVCQKIFEYAQAANAGSDEFIAYINIEVGLQFPFSDADVMKTFHHLVWDTDFSSADLNIEHTGMLRDTEIALVSLSCFSDGEHPERIIVVPLNAYRFSV
ncbi:MAG TPA: hypothetical protein IAA30_10060 [Candidatus Treponema faecavium]|nr:hypothetical protein [Candidatus Treponema faecavium]